MRFDQHFMINKELLRKIVGYLDIENNESVLVKCMGGEIWHDLVLFVVERGWWGIENLSLIPGTVGAAPMQNIGAYGAELKNVLENVEAFDLRTGEKKIFQKSECEFGYRDSVFKNKLKDKYFISAITLKLSKTPKPNLSYKALQDYLENLSVQAGKKIEIKNSKDISDAVSSIRRSKLPNPLVIPNAGSFFKNVFIEKEKLAELLKVYPNMPYFEEDEENGSPASVLIKVPSAWLIERAGWKGKRVGNAGVHERQALVLVNYGGASGKKIKNLADKIIADVKEKFGLNLALEVTLI